MKCSTEYGSPSGHALSTIFYFYLLFDYYLFFRSKSFYFLYIFSIFSVGISRVYMGVHGFNQVLEGWCYGLILLSIYK